MIIIVCWCRYTQWRRKALAKQRRRGPAKILLGLLLPVLAGFVIAKTGVGSKSTKHAMHEASRKVRLHKLGTHPRDCDTPQASGFDLVQQDAEAEASKSEPAGSEAAVPLHDKKFLGIF